jgi:hypothetical protein
MDKKMELAYSKTNAAGEPDEEAIFNSLKSLEEELRFKLTTLDNKIEKKGDKASDKLKKK